MLSWRAVGFAAADGAPDVIRGLQVMEVANYDREARGDKPAAQPARPDLLDVPDNIDQDQDAAFLDQLTTPLTLWDSASHLAGLKLAAEGARTTADLDTQWDWHNRVSDGKLSRAEQDEAKSLYEAAAARLGA